MQVIYFVQPGPHTFLVTSDLYDSPYTCCIAFFSLHALPSIPPFFVEPFWTRGSIFPFLYSIRVMYLPVLKKIFLLSYIFFVAGSFSRRSSDGVIGALLLISFFS